MGIQKKRISQNINKKVSSSRKPSQKVLFIEIDDEVTQVFEKINKSKFKKIYLVVPQRAVLFQSSINLKILLRKAIDLEKKLYIVTTDPNGINLCERVGIEAFTQLNSSDHPLLIGAKIKEETDISPLKASVNSIDEENPSRRTLKKFSISELIRKGSGGKINIVPKNKTLKTSSSGKSSASKSSLVFSAPSLKNLIALVSFSLIILLFVSYVALPGATLVLTPKSSVLMVSTNVILADFEKNRAELDLRPAKTIPSYRVSTEITKIAQYQATGKEFTGMSATGKILIKNLSSNEWPLIPNTRFQTADGLIFRIGRQVLVPAGTPDNPGTLEVEVTADQFDAFNQVIGERGNLKENTTFFLPGLSADNQKRLFAESVGEFSNGVTNVQKLISQEDIDAARSKMRDDLLTSAEAELKASIAERNALQKMNLTLLNAPNSIKMSEADIQIPPNLAGQKLDSFEVRGKTVASGIAFDRENLLTIMKNELKLKKNPEKTLAYVDDDSLSYRLIENNEEHGKIKITATIQGIEEYDISPARENGERLIKKIKEHIVGKSKDEARNFIQNLPEIENAKINMWPAWTPNIPSVPDNIKVEIKRQ